MAYTYEDFSKRAQSEGLLAQFTAEELATAQKSPEYGLALLSVKKDLAGATTEEQRLLANEAANQLRQAYGVSTAAAPSSTGGFVYSREDEYKKLFDSLTNPDGFSYDHSQDPAFSAYKKAQLREADRSMKDTLAAVSSATGGVPSSYAVSAAQQARDYEASKIGDIIPELYEAAYGRQQDALGILAEDRENEYAKYLQEQASAEAARQAQLAAPQDQQATPIVRPGVLPGVLPGVQNVQNAINATVQDVVQATKDPVTMARNDAIGKLLAAGNPYNTAVGNKVGTDNRLNALRNESQAQEAGTNGGSEKSVDFDTVRSNAFTGLAVNGQAMSTVLQYLQAARSAGQITQKEYYDILQQLNAFMEE